MIHPSARVHPSAFVDPETEIADGVEIGPLCVVEKNVAIGSGTRLLAHVTVLGPTRIGRHNVLYPGCVLGGDPQDNSYRGEPTTLEVGDHNRIREGVTMNRGTVKGGGKTVVGSDGLFMACAHVAHDCQVGSRVIVANNVLLAGHVQLGDGAILNGAAAFHHFVTIGRLAYVGGQSRIVHDVPPFLKVEGSPGRPRAVNAVGLKRRGVSDAAIEALEQAFRELFRSGKPLLLALNEMRESCAEVSELLAFLRRSSQAPTGRYLEQFRADAAKVAAAASGSSHG
ncbi:MAG: acyl-ACP--UDP-N-acetylglucosamine O-acyltransferase [Planctomycetota bacterium]